MQKILEIIKNLFYFLSIKRNTIDILLNIIWILIFILQLIIIIVLLLIFFVYIHNIFLKGLMSFFIISLYLILKRSLKLIKNIQKEISSLVISSKEKKELILYTFIMLSVANISLFVFF